MTVYVTNIPLGLDEDQERCYEIALTRLGLAPDRIVDRFVVKRSVDARHRNSIKLNYTVGFALAEGVAIEARDGIRLVEHQPLTLPMGSKAMTSRPVVVGFGPSGLFCALYLARMGYRPLVLERGGAMADRVTAVERFRRDGTLSEQSNVQFGEGGAGTFSDGKLTTRINDSRCDAVLADLVRAGAPEEILRTAKPHIGTDYLRDVVTALGQEIVALGGELRFDTQVTDLRAANGRVAGVTAGGEEIEAEAVVLAMGHSARDSFRMLYDLGLPMETKPFSVGARIEHLQAQVDRQLYGDAAGHPLLPKGEYQLSWRDKNGRAAYTFCMCPGGVVLPSSSTEHTVVTNGMSNYLREGENSNSALVVSVDSRDFGENPMDAIAFQLAIEKKAYEASSSYRAPVQTVGRFLEGQGGADFGTVRPSYSLGVAETNLDDILPSVVTEYMRKGLRILGQSQPGFAAVDAVLTGPETRTSSPVRILRNPDSLDSPWAEGLYPCGEGSGYAGGIMSASVDGIRAAEKIIAHYKPFA